VTLQQTGADPIAPAAELHSSVGASVGPGGSPADRPGALGDIRWTAFMYSMRSRPTRHRVALWRELHRQGGVNLLHATWGLPHRESGPPDVRALHASVDSAGGFASSAEVSSRGALDMDLGCRLVRACEQLWDGFFNRVDQLECAEGDDQLDASLALTGVRELRTEYGELAPKDLVMSGATARAARRLDRCTTWALSKAPVLTIEPGERSTRHHVVLAAAPVALTDGTMRYVARVEPALSPLWEHELRAFEAAVYRPDRTRLPINHGLFVFSCPAEERGERLAALEGRVRRFELSVV
jgi:hypothetical protein